MSGRGDYVVTNALVTNGDQDIVPSFGENGADIVYVNKEYVRDIYLPLQVSNFTPIDTVNLNPGLSESFPWLAQIAINFEEYEFVQLAFTFKSAIENTTTATNGQVGQVLMTTNYNPDAAPFGSKEEMMLYKGGMSCKSTQSMIHGVECEPALNAGSAQKFVRPGYTSESLKNFDLGVLNIAALNAPTQYLGQCLGELWVSYTIRLRKPKVSVGENYSVIRNLACANGRSYKGAFGVINDGNMDFATRTTIPDMVFIRPKTLGDTMPGHPSGYPVTSPIIWDDMDQPDPTAFIASTAPNTQYLHIGIQFPPYWSGIASIRLKEKYKVSADSYPYLDCCAQGQIFRFKDIPWDDETTDASGALPNVWTHKLNSSGKGVVATYLQENDFTLHVKVQPVQNGVQNIVYFGVPPTSTYQSLTCLRSFVDIVGIQSYQSYDDSGLAIPATRLELTNVDTQTTGLWN